MSSPATVRLCFLIAAAIISQPQYWLPESRLTCTLAAAGQSHQCDLEILLPMKLHQIGYAQMGGAVRWAVAANECTGGRDGGNP